MTQTGPRNVSGICESEAITCQSQSSSPQRAFSVGVEHGAAGCCWLHDRLSNQLPLSNTNADGGFVMLECEDFSHLPTFPPFSRARTVSVCSGCPCWLSAAHTIALLLFSLGSSGRQSNTQV